MNTVKWEEWIQTWHNGGEEDTGYYHNYTRKFENPKVALAFAEILMHNVCARNIRLA